MQDQGANVDKRFPYQTHAKMPDNNERPKLTSCYWCKQKTVAYIKHMDSIQVQCLNKDCKAKPLLGFCDGFPTYEKAATVWNSAALIRTIEAQPKKNTGNIRGWKGDRIGVDRDELKELFKSLFVEEETWKKFFPTLPYLEI